MKKFNVTFNELSLGTKIKVLTETDDKEIIMEAIEDESQEIKYWAVKTKLLEPTIIKQMIMKVQRDENKLAEILLEATDFSSWSKEELAVIAKSPNKLIRKWIISNTDDRSLLNLMMNEEWKNPEKKSTELMWMIFNHPHYDRNKNLEGTLYLFKSKQVIGRRIMAKKIKDTTVLEELLLEELGTEKDISVIADILNNKAFICRKKVVDELMFTMDYYDKEELAEKVKNREVKKFIVINCLLTSEDDGSYPIIVKFSEGIPRTRDLIYTMLNSKNSDARELGALWCTNKKDLSDFIDKKMKKGVEEDALLVAIKNPYCRLKEEQEEFLLQIDSQDIQKAVIDRTQDKKVLIDLLYEASACRKRIIYSEEILKKALEKIGDLTTIQIVEFSTCQNVYLRKALVKTVDMPLEIHMNMYLEEEEEDIREELIKKIPKTQQEISNLELLLKKHKIKKILKNLSKDRNEIEKATQEILKIIQKQAINE